MAGKWTTERFPLFEQAIRHLTEQHRVLEDEPLHLAIAYLPRRNGEEVHQGVFLFEVIGGLAEHFGQSGDLFEASFDAAPGLPTGFDQTLHLILTTPHDLEEGLSQGWPLAVEVADAVRRDDYKVLHEDPVGRKALKQIRGAVRRHRRARLVDESLAWLYQALADQNAAEREYQATTKARSRVWCYATAKYQQTVEKAVKAIVAALREAGFWRGPPIGFVHEVERHMPWLVRLPRTGEQQSVQRHLVRLFDHNVRAAIRSLQALIPQAPPPGGPLRRNTEYPFHDADGDLTYPASPGTFSREEVTRFRALSHRLAESAGWVVSTLRRRPR